MSSANLLLLRILDSIGHSGVETKWYYKRITMETSDLILIKGEPKTQQIVSMNEDRNGVYWVRFNNGKTYHLANHDVNILKSPKIISTVDCRITNKMGACFNPKQIWEYRHHFHRYYRIEFESGELKEYDENYLNISKSVLADETAKSLFNYFKDISGVQCIMTENGPVSLHDKYEKIDFVDENTTLGCYLKPKMMKDNQKGYNHLLFPFYSNLSQMAAVENAFKSQISVVQGPPGTGKTQTILNIVANIIARKQTVLIVSNNNSAVENVKEKLDKEGLGFIVAELGKSDNRNDFIKSGQTPYPTMSDWQDDKAKDTLNIIDSVSKKLQEIFEKQNLLAKDKQELAAIEIESEHFYHENDYDSTKLEDMVAIPSDELIKLWVLLDIKKEEENISQSLWQRLKMFFKNLFMKNRLKKVFGKQANSMSDEDVLMDIKALFYKVRKEELQSEIDELTEFLKDNHAGELLKKQASLSMRALKAALYINYEGGKKERAKFDSQDLWKKSDAVSQEYPIVLSTTFSATSSLPGHTFDYLIMDEASQVPVESAALALSKAKKAVIVGDLKQLPNIISKDDLPRLQEIAKTYHIDKEYDCSTNSFLSSIVNVFPNAPQTLLREHYRCAPQIIDFCNQKFYGGELVIMTAANDDILPMRVIKTVRGNHSRSVTNADKVFVSNQREVDEFKELLKANPNVPLKDVGIITPYKGQAMLFHKDVNDNSLEADTIHKYQGREKDIIVMSTVADTYNDFVDNANLINVAVSRAKKEFVLITNGNDNPDGNIKDLIAYIDYNHGKVESGHLHSIFDLLYASYAEQRKKFLDGKNSVSEYDSENIAYNVISTILKKNDDLSCLEVIPHYHLSSLISDTSLLTEDEYKFARASWSHVDFLIENRVSKKPVLVIEVDGFAYHHKGTKQEERDLLKNSILGKYKIPVLRLSTTGSGEVEKIENEIRNILDCTINTNNNE